MGRPLLDRRWFLAGVALGAALLVTGEADAAAKVTWTVTLPDSDDREAQERFLRQVLERESKRVDWGKRRDLPIDVRLDVTQLSVQASHDIVRITCSGVGKLHGGGSAHSKFSMGGHAKQRTELEHQLLQMLGRGIVTRLAQMARARR